MIKSFSNTKIDLKNGLMFFSGIDPNISRYDIQKFPIFEKLIKKQLSYFWLPEEIDVTKDRSDFKSLTESDQNRYKLNIEYQILLDSVQGRCPSLAFLPFTSDPTMETFIQTWSFFETIHSRSYTYLIQNIFSDCGEVFDNILNNQYIMDRAESVTKYYDDLMVHVGTDIKSLSRDELMDIKRKFIRAFISVNILEGIRFYASFACNFAYKENGTMEGGAKIMKQIARDEAIHLAFTQNTINIWRDGRDDPDMKFLMEDMNDEIMEMYDESLTQEMEWAKYIFKDGSMIGLNDDILISYLKYMTNIRMKTIGLDQPYDVKKDPLTWMRKYTSSKSYQPAPQEIEIESYVQGGVKMSNINYNSLKKYKF